MVAWKIIENKTREFIFTDFLNILLHVSQLQGMLMLHFSNVSHFKHVSHFCINNEHAQSIFLNVDTKEFYTKSLMGIYVMFW